MTSSHRDLAPRALHMLRKFLATRSEELQLNEAAKIILYGLSSYCYQSKQVIVNVNQFLGLISGRKFLPHHYVIQPYSLQTISFITSLTDVKIRCLEFSRLQAAK